MIEGQATTKTNVLYHRVQIMDPGQRSQDASPTWLRQSGSTFLHKFTGSFFVDIIANAFCVARMAEFHAFSIASSELETATDADQSTVNVSFNAGTNRPWTIIRGNSILNSSELFAS